MSKIKAKGKGKKADRLAEEARKAAEEAALQEETRQRKERELREQKNLERILSLFQTQQARFEEEAGDLERLSLYQTSELGRIVERLQKQKEWLEYLKCSYLPNPTIESDVNTFLSIWEQQGGSFMQEEQKSLAPFLQQLGIAWKLTGKLLEARYKSVDSQSRDVEISRFSKNLTETLRIWRGKMESLTVFLLQHMDYFMQEEDENFQMEIFEPTRDFTFGIWGNKSRNPRHKTIDFTQSKISISIPKVVALNSVAVLVHYETSLAALNRFEKQTTDEEMAVTGGILHLSLFPLPPAPKKADPWTIRPKFFPKGKLVYYDYPFPTDQVEEEVDKTLEPVSVTLHFAVTPFLSPQHCKIMFWNDVKTCWDDEGIENVELNPAVGVVKFDTVHFKPTAIIQSKYLEFPYQSWSIQPNGLNSAVFTIQGKCNTVEIEVNEDSCRLISPANIVNTVDLYEPVSPTFLLKKLSQLGLNFVGPLSLNGMKIEEFIMKDPESEAQCIKGMKVCAPSLHYRNNPTNKNLCGSKCSFQFREVNTTGGDADAPLWSTLIFDTAFKAGNQLFTMGFVPPESVSHVTDTTAPDWETADVATEIHKSVYHLLRPKINRPEAEAELRDSSALFQRTYQQLLSLTRLISFS